MSRIWLGRGDSNSRSRPPQQANTGLARDPGRAPEARAFNQLGHSPIWWLVTELNRVHWLFRPALYRRVHEPKLVDGARIELALHGCRPWIIPLYEPPMGERTVSAVVRELSRGRSGLPRSPLNNWGEMRESNSRNWSHNPAPQPFGQSRHRIWSCWLIPTSMSLLTGQVPLYVGHSSNPGAGATIRTPITDLRGPRSSH